jgi:hypothetical protein
VNRNMSNRDGIEDSWARAIFESTTCLRTTTTTTQHSHGRGQHQHQRGSNNSRAHPGNDISLLTAASLAYLDVLRELLENRDCDVDNEQNIGNETNSHETLWDRPPFLPPPDWKRFSDTFGVDPSRARSEAIHETCSNNTIRTNNSNGECDDDEAGDIPNPAAFHGSGSVMMDRRRILIRILTGQSELYSKMSSTTVAAGGGGGGGSSSSSHSQYEDSNQSTTSMSASTSFQDAASHLTTALQKIHEALHVADSQIAKWWTEQQQQLETDIATMSVVGSTNNNSSSNNNYMKQLLMEDATIVEVAIQSLTVRRDRLLEQFHREEKWLLRKLRPQWEERDAVKNRMGDRWTSNPNPKRDFAELRREYEDRLRNVRSACDQLQDDGSGQWTSAIHKANSLQTHLQTGIRYDDITPRTSDNDDCNSASVVEGNPHRRYNQQQPAQRFQNRRVNPQLYPSPTQFGWEFTGSWEAVEFYQKQENNDNSNNDHVIKLDFYFTTGTIKTSLDHPVQGRTQMFGRKVSPEEYISILMTPRTHTGRRYQTTNHRDQQQQRNSRQGGRGGRGHQNGGGGRGRRGRRGGSGRAGRVQQQ